MKQLSEFYKTIINKNPLHRSVASILIITISLLLIPLVAMQFTGEVVWDLTDFVVAGALIIGSGLSYLFVSRKVSNIIYKIALFIAIVAALLIVWINLAVGIIGAEDNPANLMFFGVIVVGIIGALISQFQPHGMSLTLLVTAITQALIAMITILAGLDSPASGPVKIILINGFFITLWLVAAWLFRCSAKERKII